MLAGWKETVVLACLVAALAPAPAYSQGGPKVTLGARAPAAARRSMDHIDHAPLATLLEKYVDRAGNVDYEGWKKTAEDVQALDDYLAQLSTAGIKGRATHGGRLAYWMNAYHAVTLRGILRDYPTQSIHDLAPRGGRYDIYNDLMLYVDGHQFSLTQIEHDVLRQLGEPRIHFALHRASVGGPKLSRAAFTAENIEGRLAAAARDFLADPANCRFGRGGGRLELSSVLEWNSTDFGPTLVQQLEYLAPYLPRDAQRAVRRGGVTVTYMEYDWGLNDQAVLGKAEEEAGER